MTNVVRYSGADGSRSPSVALWKGQAPRNGEIFNDPGAGWGHFDDFLTLNATANGYTLVEADDKASIAVLASQFGGAVRIAITGDDNEQAIIGFGSATSAPVKIDGGTGAVYLEARLRVSSVTDDVLGLLFGLVEEGSAAADMIADDGTDIADKDFVGFFVKSDDGNSVDTIFQTSGSAFTTVQADAATLVADTWFKLGIFYDGEKTITFFKDGAALTTTCLESATGFPDGEELTPILAVKVSSDAALNVDIDWLAFGQEAV